MTKDLLAETYLSTGAIQEARGLLENDQPRWEALTAIQCTVCAYEKLAGNAVLLASALDLSDAREAERRMALLQHASALLEKNTPGDSHTCDELELLAKIETLRASDSEKITKAVTLR